MGVMQAQSGAPGDGEAARDLLRPAIFFDRDGVLNADDGDGVFRPEDVEAIPGAGAALARVNKAGILAICLTNQPGLAKGSLSLSDLEAVTATLRQALSVDGGRLDDVLWCPHHPARHWPNGVPALMVDCACRKPKPGLVLEAQRRHGVDLARSFMVGDRYRDLAPGRAFGARGVLVMTGEAGSDAGLFDFSPDFIAPDLGAAVDYILAHIDG
jgi:histidinol-phosphate phosphatase family protein